MVKILFYPPVTPQIHTIFAHTENREIYVTPPSDTVTMVTDV